MEETKSRDRRAKMVGEDEEGTGRHYTRGEIKYGRWYADIELGNNNDILKEEEDLGYDTS